MRRGRWVAYFIAFLCILTHYTLHPTTYPLQPTTSHASSLAMTATVPLSSVWKESLRINSQAQLDTSHPHILIVSQESLGIEKLPVSNQTIQLLVLKNNVLVHEQIKVTDKKGVADFVYVAEKPGTYFIIVVNKLDDKPFVVKSGTVTL